MCWWRCHSCWKLIFPGQKLWTKQPKWSINYCAIFAFNWDFLPCCSSSYLFFKMLLLADLQMSLISKSWGAKHKLSVQTNLPAAPPSPPTWILRGEPQTNRQPRPCKDSRRWTVEGFRSRCRGCRRYGLPLPWRTPFLPVLSSSGPRLLDGLSQVAALSTLQICSRYREYVGGDWRGPAEKKGSKDEVDGGGDELRWDEGSRESRATEKYEGKKIVRQRSARALRRMGRLIMPIKRSSFFSKVFWFSKIWKNV
jgi:hypothetical protein